MFYGRRISFLVRNSGIGVIMTEQEVLKGLDYLTLTSYNRIDKSDLSFEKKRDVLYSTYCFRCVFDDTELKRASGVLTRYGVSFVFKDRPEGDGVIEITDGDKKAYKFDVGSPAFSVAVKNGTIDEKFRSLPQKLTLFELPLEITALPGADDELKAMWYIYFPYVILMGAPVEYDLYESLKARLCNPGVFSRVLESRYSENMFVTREEMVGEHPLIVDWYGAFIDWKNEKTEKGISRATAFIQKKLALGDYDYVMRESERMLDCFPDDEELLLLNVAGRMSACASVDFETRVKMLAENFRIINDAITGGNLKKYNYFLYYRGLTRLGMKDMENAKTDFDACLKIDPKFEPALLMLKGMENAAEKQSACSGECSACSEKCDKRDN